MSVAVGSKLLAALKRARQLTFPMFLVPREEPLGSRFYPVDDDHGAL